MADSKGSESLRLDCEVGGVHHVAYKCTPNVHHIIRTRVGERGKGRDGRVFPYVAHYLSTGDMLYPAHEGEAMVSRLLDELTRLDLVDDLLHARPNVPSCVPVKQNQGSRRFSVGDGGDTLKVHTRRRRRITLAGLLHHLLPAPSSTSPSNVYRPPSNKGTTLVVVSTSVHRSTEVVVHGPAHALRTLLPTTPVLTTHATYPLLDSRAAPIRQAAPDLLDTLKDKGYTPTVRSSWVVGHTGALVTQWLVYKRRGGWGGGGNSKTLSRRPLPHAASTDNLDTVEGEEGEEGGEEGSRNSGTLRHKLRARSKSIMSLATEHRPTLTLKRILSVLL